MAPGRCLFLPKSPSELVLLAKCRYILQSPKRKCVVGRRSNQGKLSGFSIAMKNNMTMSTTMMMGNMTASMTTTVATTMTTTLTVAWLQVATKLCNNLFVLLLCLSQVIFIVAECKTRLKFYSYGRVCHQFEVFGHPASCLINVNCELLLL